MRDLPTFRDAYRKRRCIVPVDGFFEWKAVKGQRAKQPYAIAMKDGAPFGLAGIWENWKEPASGESCAADPKHRAFLRIGPEVRFTLFAFLCFRPAVN